MMVTSIFKICVLQILLAGHIFPDPWMHNLCKQLTSEVTCQTWGYGILCSVRSWLYSHLGHQQQNIWLALANVGLLLTCVDRCLDAALSLGEGFVMYQLWCDVLIEVLALLKAKFGSNTFAALRIFLWKLNHKLRRRIH